MAAEKNTKERILEEAENLFAENGFEATGIEAIAKAAGIRKSVIYYHFENKDDILKALFNKYLSYMREMKIKKVDLFFTTRAKPRDLVDVSTRDREIERWYKMVKIMVLETLTGGKYKTMLFDLWKENMDILYENYSDHMQENAKENYEKIFFETFFLMYMPRLMYIILEDEWSKRYHKDKETLRQDYVDMSLKLFETVKGDLWKA